MNTDEKKEKSATKRALRELKKGVKEDAGNIKENLVEKYEYGKERTKNYISKNPSKSVGIAAGVGAAAGIVTGAAINSRRKKKRNSGRINHFQPLALK